MVVGLTRWTKAGMGPRLLARSLVHSSGRKARLLYSLEGRFHPGTLRRWKLGRSDLTQIALNMDAQTDDHEYQHGTDDQRPSRPLAGYMVVIGTGRGLLDWRLRSHGQLWVVHGPIFGLM